MDKIEHIKKTHDFHWGNHKGENPSNFLKIVQSQRLCHKIIKSNNKKYSTDLSLSPSLSLSYANFSKCEVCINELGCLPTYTNQVSSLLHDWGWHVTLTGMTSPRETPNTHFMMLQWGLLPRLTT